MDIKKVLYLYGIFVLVSWGFMFTIYHEDYTKYETIKGMGFISVVAIIFFILVHLNYKNKLGKKIVNWSLVALFILNCICFYFIVF